MKPARVLALIFVWALTATTAVGAQSFLFRATDLGPVNAASPIEITIWMKLHDQQGLDALVAAQQAGKAGYLSMRTSPRAARAELLQKLPRSRTSSRPRDSR